MDRMLYVGAVQMPDGRDTNWYLLIGEHNVGRFAVESYGVRAVSAQADVSVPDITCSIRDIDAILTALQEQKTDPTALEAAVQALQAARGDPGEADAQPSTSSQTGRSVRPNRITCDLRGTRNTRSPRKGGLAS